MPIVATNLLLAAIESVEMVVVYTLRGDTIRLISARKAKGYEREDYWHR